MPETHDGFRCDGCNRLYPMQLEHAHEVIGWEKARSDGGPDRLVDKRKTGKIICAACLSAARSGVTPGQEQMKL